MSYRLVADLQHSSRMRPMLRIEGARHRFCGGISRHSFLQTASSRTYDGLRKDPILLAWMVNQVDGYDEAINAQDPPVLAQG